MADLPEFIAPMLAKRAEPFDSEAHFFEVKWDGVRAVAFCEEARTRVYSRRRTPLLETYPELEFLRDLDSGLVLDGEIVLFTNDRPDIERLLARQHGKGELRRRTAAAQTPVTYIVFDLLFRGGESMLERPLTERRKVLREVVEAAGEPRLIYSDGVVAEGRALFEQTCERGLEGVMAKRLDSRYAAGARSDAWLKIKRTRTLLCVILGYVPAGRDDFKSLILGAEDEDGLRCVGKVGSGVDEMTRRRLCQELRARPRASPLVEAPFDGKWVEPELFCTVTYLEWTSARQLRAPVFQKLVVE